MNLILLLVNYAIDNPELVITVIGFAGGYWKIRNLQKESDIKIKEAQATAEVSESHANTAVVQSQAKQQNAITELALEQSRDSRKTFELMMELQGQIVTLERELATTQTKLETAQTAIAKLEEQVKYYQEREESHKAARRQWEITQMELVKRISDIRKGDTDRLNETLPLPDLPNDPDAVEPPTKPPEVTAVDTPTDDNASNDDDENNLKEAS